MPASKNGAPVTMFVVTSMSTPDHRRPGDFILDWLSKLHFGTFGGLAIKALWAVLGLAPAVLSVTGMFMFWKRTSNKNNSNATSVPAQDRDAALSER
jgi:uncharacterized iron-regulated membrane protein